MNRRVLAEVGEAVNEVRRAAAEAAELASATEEQFDSVSVAGVMSSGDRRSFERVAHMVELTARATQGVSEASEKIFAIVEAASELRRVALEADALAAASEEQFARVVGGMGSDDRRAFERVPPMVELTTRATQATAEASKKLFAIVDRTLSGMKS